MGDPSSAALAGGRIGTSRVTAASTVVGGAIGNLIEWYDWAIVGLLAGVFAP